MAVLNAEEAASQFLQCFEEKQGTQPKLCRIGALAAVSDVGQAILRLCAERGIPVELS